MVRAIWSLRKGRVPDLQYRLQARARNIRPGWSSLRASPPTTRQTTGAHDFEKFQETLLASCSAVTMSEHMRTSDLSL